jgi:hypothetical protein
MVVQERERGAALSWRGARRGVAAWREVAAWRRAWGSRPGTTEGRRKGGKEKEEKEKGEREKEKEKRKKRNRKN